MVTLGVVLVVLGVVLVVLGVVLVVLEVVVDGNVPCYTLSFPPSL